MSIPLYDLLMNTAKPSIQLVSNLAALMDDQEVTITGLAEQAGITRVNLSLIRSGQRIPALPTALMIARALGVNVSDIWHVKKSRKRRARA